MQMQLLRVEYMLKQNDEEPKYKICLFTYTYFSSTPKYINKCKNLAANEQLWVSQTISGLTKLDMKFCVHSL